MVWVKYTTLQHQTFAIMVYVFAFVFIWERVFFLCFVVGAKETFSGSDAPRQHKGDVIL